MRKRKWGDEQLVEAVIKSSSTRQVLNIIGLRPAGGNYLQISKHIKRLNLDDGKKSVINFNLE